MFLRFSLSKKSNTREGNSNIPFHGGTIGFRIRDAPPILNNKIKQRLFRVVYFLVGNVAVRKVCLFAIKAKGILRRREISCLLYCFTLGGLVSKRLNLGLAVKVSSNFPPQPVPLFTLK